VRIYKDFHLVYWNGLQHFAPIYQTKVNRWSGITGT